MRRKLALLTILFVLLPMALGGLWAGLGILREAGGQKGDLDELRSIAAAKAEKAHSTEPFTLEGGEAAIEYGHAEMDIHDEEDRLKAAEDKPVAYFLITLSVLVTGLWVFAFYRVVTAKTPESQNAPA